MAVAIGVQLLCTAVFALDPAKSPAQYNCRTWTRRAGLPVNGLSAIAQSREGYIWLASTRGLVRFDGSDFSIVDFPTNFHFRGQSVGSLSPSKSGGVWFGHEYAPFARYTADGEVNPAQNLAWLDPRMETVNLLEAGDGCLWVGFRNGVARYVEGDSAQTFFTDQVQNCWTLYEDSAHRIWFGTLEHGLYVYEAGRINPFPDASLKPSLILALARDHEDRLWVGTEMGLRCYDADYRRIDAPPMTTQVSALLVDRDGALWIGTIGDGLVRYYNGSLQYLKRSDGLANNSVTALMEDREGCIWIGTRDGFSQLTDIKFPLYSAAEGFVGGACHSVSPAKGGGLWCANNTGLSRFGDPPMSLTAESGLSSSFTKRALETRSGDVYVITGNRTVDRISGGKVIGHYPSSSWPTALAEDEQGVVVSLSTNLVRIGPNGFEPFDYQGAPTPEYYWIRNLVAGPDGALFIASVNGVFRIKDGTVQHWGAETGLADLDVFCVTPESEILWAGFAGGIARIETNRLINITRDNGLPPTTIFAIVPDAAGNLWCNSLRGILRLDRRSLDEFAEGRTNQVRCELFDGLEAVKTIDTTDVEYVGCRTEDGCIWFPSPQGILKIDPSRVPINQTPPLVRIVRVLANGIELSPSGGASALAKPGDDDLEIQYTALSYVAPQRVRFRYRLVGCDEDWIDAGTRRAAFYTNLKPGKYRFMVQASNSDGVWSTTEEAVAIDLPPQFYQTGWFYCVAGCGLAVLLLGIYSAGVRHLRRKHQNLQAANELLESKVASRTHELAEQRNLLRTLIDHLPDNVFVKDTESRIILNNLAHARTLGVAGPEEAAGKTDFNFLPQPLATKFYEDEQQVIETGSDFNGEETGLDRTTGRQCWFRTTKVPLRDRDGKIIGIAGINRDITERKQWEERLAQMHKELLEVSRQAGMAEVATSVLHNVGNVLNSVNVSASLIENRIRSSETDNLGKVAAMLRQNRADLANFLTKDEKGRRLVEYIEALVQHREKEKASTLDEIRSLVLNIEHIKEVVSMQQAYARISGIMEPTRPSELMQDALRMHQGAFERHGVQIVREFKDAPQLTTDRHKVIQILVNLLQNAKYACDPVPPERRLVTVRIAPKGTDRIQLAVADKGIGIPEENLTRIFSHGFTTRKNGHGFGLHGSALAARELGGSLSVRSEGPDRGAEFILELPLDPPASLRAHTPKVLVNIPGNDGGSQTDRYVAAGI